MHAATATDERASDRVVDALDRRAGDGTLAVVAGGAVLFVAGRLAADSTLRSALAAIVGAGLIGYGVDKRVALSDSQREADEGTTDESDWHPARGGDATTDRPRTGRDPSIEEATDGRPSGDDPAESESRRSVDESTTSIDIAPASSADESGDATGSDLTQAESNPTEATELEDDPDDDVDDQHVDSDASSDRDELDEENQSDEEDSRGKNW